MSDHTLGGEILARQLTHPIAADLADEVSRQTTASRPHGDIGGTAAGHQHHLAERVATPKQFVVRTNQHVPREVADDAQLDLAPAHRTKARAKRLSYSRPSCSRR